MDLTSAKNNWSKRNQHPTDPWNNWTTMQRINLITNNSMLESDATHKEERYATATPASQKTPNPGHTKYASRRKLGKPTHNQSKSQPTRRRSPPPPGQFG